MEENDLLELEHDDNKERAVELIISEDEMDFQEQDDNGQGEVD